MRKFFLFSLFVSAVALSQQPTPDQAFYAQAGEAGIAEVDAGKLAQSRATSAPVKEFAAMMVTDHSQANEKLKAIAMNKKVMLPTAPNAEHQAMKKKLEGTAGAAFDKAYIEGQVADHTKVVALLQAEIDSGKDADAKAWASEALPTVKAHLAQAKKLASGSMESMQH
jgi:putative membrane protein